MFKSIEELRSYCKENEIVMIDFKMVDIDGKWRHVTIPAKNFNENTLKYGIGFDGSNYGYAALENSDMVFIPDMASARPDSFASVRTLSMTGTVCIIGKDSNVPFGQYPKNIVIAAEKYMRDIGVADKIIIGPEFEFHVFDKVKYKVKPGEAAYSLETAESEESAFSDDEKNHGYHLSGHDGYHADLPQDVTADLRSEICVLLEKWGVAVKYHHHEVGGSGQLEIETELGEMSDMADKTMIVKYVIKNAAQKSGRSATFMPKPIYGQAGNGMHVHMLLLKDGKGVFYDEKGYAGLSQTAHWFIGGLLEHASAVCAFTNPSTNSFKRLVPGFEAPVTIGYATANRSAVIRIPAYAKTPETKRFELRNPDATCNPYFAYAAILMAGLDGIRKKIDPSVRGWGPFDFNLYNLSQEEQKKIASLPRSLNEALDALEKDNLFLTEGGVFPKELISAWIKRKRAQVARVESIPNPAEIAEYYNC